MHTDLLSLSVNVVDNVCDCSVVIDSRLTMSDHVTALSVGLATTRCVQWSSDQDPSPGIHILLPQLLWHAALCYHGQLVPASHRHQSQPFCCICIGCQWKNGSSLNWLFWSSRGETPLYLEDYCQIIADSGRRCLHSADVNDLTVLQTRPIFPTRRQEFCSGRTESMEWFSRNTVATWHWILAVQTTLKTFLFGKIAAH